MSDTHGTVIRFFCDPDTLADVPYNEFVARLYDAFKDRWPGALIDIVQGNGRSWGETITGGEITAEELQQIANDVFERACYDLAD